MPSVATPSKASQANVGRPLHQHRLAAARALRHLHQPQRVGAVGRADHDHRVAARRDRLDGGLPVGRGVADVLLARPDDGREPRLEDGDDRRRIVHRQRRLRGVGEPAGSRGSNAARVRDGLDQRGGAGRQLAQRADHLGMPGVADQHDLQALGMVRPRLGVHLGDQRAGRIEVVQAARLGSRRHGLRHAMCRKDHGCTGFGNLVQLLHKYGAFGLQGSPPRDDCGRSRGARRRGGRTASAPVPRS